MSDETLSVTISQIQRSPRGELRRLAEAFRLYAQARQYFRDSYYSEAASSFYEALNNVSNQSSPFARWTRFWLAGSLLIDGFISQARREMSLVREVHVLQKLPYLAARLHWSEGLLELRTGSLVESLKSFEDASAAYSLLRESQLAGATLALAAESEQALGLETEAWRTRIEAFYSPAGAASGYMNNLLLDASEASRRTGYLRAALVLLSVGLENAKAMASPSRVVEILILRSKILRSLGRVAAERDDFEAAQREIQGLPDDRLRDRLTADIKEARGTGVATSDPKAAVDLLTSDSLLQRSRFPVQASCSLSEPRKGVCDPR